MKQMGAAKIFAVIVTLAIVCVAVGTAVAETPFDINHGTTHTSDSSTVEIPEVTPEIIIPDEPAADVPVPTEPTVPDEPATDVPAAPTIDPDAIVLDNETIHSQHGPAISVEEGATVKYAIVGTCTIISDDDDAIYVPYGSTLIIMGYDENSSLTVIGGAESGAGSGIGAHGNCGDISIIGLANLSATGNGVHAYGIGGDKANVSIENTHITSAFGGMLQTQDGSYLSRYVSSHGKTDSEGGPGIGGLDISIDNSTVDLVVGGIKAAGIGARHWTAVSISIVDSTIGEVYGGGSAAGIGGSRFSSESAEQYVNIYIENSRVTAYGGKEAAGIGSGYDTHCSKVQGECHIEIVSNSVISATGGDYAAGIGTGFHHGNLTGFIDATVDISDVHAGSPSHYKDSYTDAQAIGYGVCDPAREGEIVVNAGTPSFTVAGEVIANPFA